MKKIVSVIIVLVLIAGGYYWFNANQSNWNSSVKLSPTEVSVDPKLNVETFQKTNSQPSFVEFVNANKGVFESVKYFKVAGHDAARVRRTSSDQYDADVAWYYVDAGNGLILAFSTSGDKKYLYDDDSKGMSSRDNYIASFEPTK